MYNIDTIDVYIDNAFYVLWNKFNKFVLIFTM